MKLLKRKNYLPWKIHISDFPKSSPITEQIKFILRFGLLAPSGHNGQPWEFEIINNSLHIFKKKERALLKSDPPGRQFYISLGCLVENIAIASNYFGFNAQIYRFFSDIENSPLIKIDFIKNSPIQNDENHLIHAILTRSSNRNKFSSEPLPENFISSIKKLSSEKFKINIISDMIQKNEAAKITVEAQIAAMENSEFRQELSELMKHNLTTSKIGMPGWAFGLPLPISFFAALMIKKLNMSKLNQKTDLKLLNNFTPAFVVISASDDTVEKWFEVGRIFEKIWLMAEKSGLKSSPNAAPVQSKLFQEKLQNLLNTNFVPLVFMRVGYCKIANQHTPRLNLEDLLK